MGQLHTHAPLGVLSMNIATDATLVPDDQATVHYWQLKGDSFQCRFLFSSRPEYSKVMSLKQMTALRAETVEKQGLTKPRYKFKRV